MTHLGDAASALLDDELDAETHRRMHAHIAGCPACRADVDAERAVKARVAGATVEIPALPDLLLGALLGIADARHVQPPQPAAAVEVAADRPKAWRLAPAAPRGRADSAGPGRAGVSGRAGLSVPRGLRPAGVHPRGRYVAAAGLAASVVVGLGGGSIASGAGSVAHAPSGPSSSASTIETAVTTTPVPASSATSSMTVLYDNRPMLRQPGGAALTVVYRRP